MNAIEAAIESLIRSYTIQLIAETGELYTSEQKILELATRSTNSALALVVAEYNKLPDIPNSTLSTADKVAVAAHEVSKVFK